MQIIDDYRSLHAIAELDKTLPETLAYIRYRLSPLKCRLFSPTAGALCAYFSFSKERTIAFRADTDALPIEEKTSLPWKSRHTGNMHACGHDGHTAILLELARRINHAKDLPYNVLLIFQPAEETTGGAEAICKTGVLEQYRVACIFALHLWPGLDNGIVFSNPGDLMSSCTEIKVSFSGKGGHIADPLPGSDALKACCCFYERANNSLGGSYLLKFGKLSGGTAGNVLCHTAELLGSLRTFREDVKEKVCAALLNLCKQTEKETGCHGEIHFQAGYPPVYNDPELWKRVQKKCSVSLLGRTLWTGEDFSYYQKKIPGIYFLLGIGDTPPLHSPHFTFDERVLSTGADFFWQLLYI